MHFSVQLFIILYTNGILPNIKVAVLIDHFLPAIECFSVKSVIVLFRRFFRYFLIRMFPTKLVFITRLRTMTVKNTVEEWKVVISQGTKAVIGFSLQRKNL